MKLKDFAIMIFNITAVYSAISEELIPDEKRTHAESIREHNRNLDCKFLKSKRKSCN